MKKHFSKFRKNTIGINHSIQTPFNKSAPIVYADWTASGRIYKEIEDKLQQYIFPLVANTHTNTNDTGRVTTFAYLKAREIIKAHVGASCNDILVSSTSGMTEIINKLQRIIGLKLHESLKSKIKLENSEKPIVFISHIEHHYNQTTWYETIADVEIINADENGLVSVNNFRKVLSKYKNRKNKILSITACSNLTGIKTPYMHMAELIHKDGGLIFVDFTCSAPYINIDMHENDSKLRYLDAIFFSPHKFLGGPGSTGILVFNKKIHNNSVSDHSRVETVEETNTLGGNKYVDSIEDREDGGTPFFLQTIKAAMCCQLKDKMGTENILKREQEIMNIIWDDLNKIDNLHVLAKNIKDRLAIISFYIDDLHYYLGVRMLNDKFGIQTQGGCSSGSTYGRYLLNIDEKQYKNIKYLVEKEDYSKKPGWIRISFHPTMTDEEIVYILESIHSLSINHEKWAKEYDINLHSMSILARQNDNKFKVERYINACFDFSKSNVKNEFLIRGDNI